MESSDDMDLKNIKWDKNNYNDFIKYLKDLSESKYKDFHKKILNNNDIKLMGIRTPILRKLAKEISKGDYISFIKSNQHKYYEETLIHGLILGNLKIEDKNLFKLIDEFTIYIDNWATCDITCSNLKQFNNIDIKYINKYIKSNNPWIIRFGIVLLIDYYVKNEYLKSIFDICDKTNIDEYYVKMAIAWLISICYIKYPNITINYLKNNNLDKFTQNKSISKICDSYRVEKSTKNELKKLKI